VADEAYRAVFLRVHPTGKMVLSLTTEADGSEGRYAQRVAQRLGVPPLDVKVVPADTNRFGTGHGFNTSPSGGVPAAIDSATDKLLAKAHLIAAVALETPADAVRWTDGAFVSESADGAQGVQTIADVALYAHGSGALPPGVEGGLDAQTVYTD
jgi:aerobic carbon-monoxide dehydrogenase large subunit